MSTSCLLSTSTLTAQGAEAKIYKSSLHGVPILLKHRFPKKYRHPVLDGSLTKARIAGEARALMRCLKSGVNVPAVRMVDPVEGVLGIEWIEGQSVRHLLPGGAEEEWEEPRPEAGQSDEEEEIDVDPLLEFHIDQDTLMDMIGGEIAKMHGADIIHGDLTTSNMMLRHPLSCPPSLPTELLLIDFGLSYHSTLPEDKAVDLYVLERAFASTHPDSTTLFARVLEAYERRSSAADWASVRRRLDDVRLRGRKRSMVG